MTVATAVWDTAMEIDNSDRHQRHTFCLPRIRRRKASLDIRRIPIRSTLLGQQRHAPCIP